MHKHKLYAQFNFPDDHFTDAPVIDWYGYVCTSLQSLILCVMQAQAFFSPHINSVDGVVVTVTLTRGIQLKYSMADSNI